MASILASSSSGGLRLWKGCPVSSRVRITPQPSKLTTKRVWRRCTRRSGVSRRRWPGAKGNLVSSLPPAERPALIEWGAGALPFGVQADLLGIGRSSLYYRPRPSSPEEVALKHRIDAIYTQY